jgi:hypothetical protein
MNAADGTIDRVEQARRLASIAGLCAIAASLTIGLAASLAGGDAIASRAFTIAAVLLVVMPMVSVLAVLAVEIVRRDWWFAAAACGVIALIGYRLLTLVR